MSVTVFIFVQWNIFNAMCMKLTVHFSEQQFKVEPMDSSGNQYYKNTGTSYCADLNLDGVTYKGYGTIRLYLL
jgi:hypothetical protein